MTLQRTTKEYLLLFSKEAGLLLAYLVDHYSRAE